MESPFLAARGGSGGKGNKFFATSLNQSPMICEYGSVGERMEYLLEMAVIAHVGLVGYPNAGKSTLLSALTRARPKVASYPFTTLKANVGIIPFDDFSQIRVADIPGLIDGAWANKGLGHSFLRHVQRCVCLIYIVDLTWDPKKQLETLQNELRMYDPTLVDKPAIVVGNKIDLPEAQSNAEDFKTDLNISGKHSVNLKTLITLIKTFYDESKDKSLKIST
jgi:GTP-binding protein